MSWGSLGSTKWPTNNDILDAISLGIFTLRPSQTLSSNNNFITVSEANTKIAIVTITGTSTRWPVKSEFVAESTTFEVYWAPSGASCETV